MTHTTGIYSYNSQKKLTENATTRFSASTSYIFTLPFSTRKRLEKKI